VTICGLLRLDGEPAERAVLEAMHAASTVPSPPRRWVHLDGPFGVVAAAEPALGAAPPVAVDQAGMVVVLDGSLGRGPPDDGPPGDAALAAASYREHGEGGFDRLAGDWVSVVWEPSRGRLLCARAELAMRRLLTWHDGRRFVFGTELTQLVAAGVPARLNQAFLGEVLCRAVSTFHETLLSGVERLPAGQLAVVSAGRRPLRRRFATLRSVVAAPTPVDRDRAAAGLRPRLDQAVAAAMDDDATGVLVSGGVDSSAVSALAHRHATAGGSPGRLRPVAVTFPGRAHDESGWLDALDQHLGCRTLRLLPDAYDWDRWRAWTALSWEPPPSPGGALLCGALRPLAEHGVRVVLTGEGGDDWFRGWRWHWPDLLRSGRVAALWRESGDGPPTFHQGLRRAARVGREAAGPLLHRVPAPRPPEWVDRRWIARIGLHERLRAAVADASAFASHDHRGRWRPAMPCVAPVYEAAQQRHTALGVDWRHPLRDRRVVEYLLALHGSVLFAATESKPLLRRAVGDLLPTAIRRRDGKARFDAVFHDAYAGVGGIEALAGHAMVEEGWVDLAVARRHYRNALARHRAGLTPTGAHDALVSFWPLFAAATWLDQVPAS
jgi:asparagine synthase (glutamine-hydrolysing)